MVEFGEILKFDPGQIQEIFGACSGQQETCSAIDGHLKNLSDLHTWQGDASQAAKDAAGKTRKDLDAHGNEVWKVAAAARDCYNEAVELKTSAQRVQADADAKGFVIDPTTGTVTDPNPPVMRGWADADKAAFYAEIDALQARVNDVIAAAERFDDDLAAAINAADGSIPIDSLPPSRAELQRSFESVYGRPPRTDSECRIARMLDRSTTEPLYGGMQSNVVVTRIKPAPGQGVVRGSLFISGQKVFDPFAAPDQLPSLITNKMARQSYQDYGNNRGFDPYFDPQNAKGAFAIDYENGYVIYRQNPSVDTQNTRAIGVPDVRVTQASDGSVRMDYKSPNPLANFGPISTPEVLQKDVQGTLIATPSASGPAVSGTVGDYPSFEAYSDRPDGSTQTLVQDAQDNHSRFGPLLELGSYHVVGDPPPQQTMDELHYDPYEYKLSGAASGLRNLPFVPDIVDRVPVPEIDEFKVARDPGFAPGAVKLNPIP